MRLALVSDIHGNAVAFEAVLADLHQQAVDSIVCLGDVATLGPEPLRAIELVQALNCPCVQGNHEAALLNPQATQALSIGPHLVSTMDWCRQQLTAAHRAWFGAFAPTLTVPLDGTHHVLCFHGTPRSNTEIVLATTPPEELDTLFGDVTTPVLVGGHTHIQLLRQHRGRLLINSGSVCSAFMTPPIGTGAPTLLPRAEYAILTWANGAPSVEFRRVPFDLAEFLRRLDASTLPLKDWWRTEYTRNWQ